MHEVKSSIYSLLNDTRNFKRKEFKKPKHIPELSQQQQQHKQQLLQLQIDPMIPPKKGINRKGKSRRMMLTQSNNNETVIKQNDIMLSQLRYYNYYKYSGRYRSRMLRMNKNDRNYSNINNIPSIDENNEGNEYINSNDQELLSHKIDIYHKQLGPGRTLVQKNTNSKGGAMVDDDIDSDRYPSWFLLTSYHYHNQAQPLTTLKALATSSSYSTDLVSIQASALPSSSSSLYVPIQRRQSEINDSPKMFLADLSSLSERS